MNEEKKQEFFEKAAYQRASVMAFYLRMNDIYM